jgi:hypothetical protein
MMALVFCCLYSVAYSLYPEMFHVQFVELKGTLSDEPCWRKATKFDLKSSGHIGPRLNSRGDSQCRPAVPNVIEVYIVSELKCVDGRASPLRVHSCK